jgi:uncharacterized protein (DUF169 family)
MDRLRLLTEKIGGWWTGVKFHYDDAPDVGAKMEPMRFCEAIAASRTRQITLTPKTVNCPGARCSFGWTSENDPELVAAIAEKADMTPDVAKGLVFDTPRLRTAPTAITVGECVEPDVALSFIQAEATMRMLRCWEGHKGNALSAELSSVMAVCGNVAVKAYLTDRICLSFGCPDSRKYGAIGRDQLVVGLPMSRLEDLL